MNYDELLFESTESKKKSGKKKWVILLLLLLLIAAAGVFVISGGLTLIFPGLAPGSGSSPLGGGLVIDPNAGDYVAPEPTVSSTPGVIIPGWGSMTIPANTQVLDMVDFHNPDGNAGLYYLTFKLCLLDANGEISEVLWESQAVPPGKHIQKITMSRGLPAGTYNAVVHVQPYRMSDETPTNSANMETILKVV